MTTYVINPGFARSGTTAIERNLRDSRRIATPRDVKELKYFLQATCSLEDYASNFDPGDGEDVIYESSPPYCHGGIDRFGEVLDNIAATIPEGSLRLLFSIREPKARAFSHYWHDINTHHAIFGARWSVSKRNDERRFGQIYRRSFFDELSTRNGRDKLFPAYGQMLRMAVDRFGEGVVRIGRAADVDFAMSNFLTEIGIDTGSGVEVARTMRTASPYYIYGGPNGTLHQLLTEEGPRVVRIPPKTALLVTVEGFELLSADTYDIEQIVAGATNWTYELHAATLPDGIGSHIDRQTGIVAELPEVCFLGGTRDELLTDLANDRQTYSVRRPPVTTDQVRHFKGLSLAG